MEKGKPYSRFLDHWLTSLGRRALVDQKLYAMLVASDGQRRYANSRRRPKQVIRISFRSTTLYLLSLLVVVPIPSCSFGLRHLTHDTR
jgi:hypothetical protein